MTFDEFIQSFGSKPAPRIRLAWEVLPALDGSLHAVDPEPMPSHFAPKDPEFSVSLCGRTLQVKRGVVLEGADLCEVCQELSRERQAEFDAEQEEGAA